MLADRVFQVVAASVVQKEDALPEAPQRRGAEFPSCGGALRDVVGEPDAHVMQQQVGVEIRRLEAQPWDGGVACARGGRLARPPADAREPAFATADGARASGAVGLRLPPRVKALDTAEV